MSISHIFRRSQVLETARSSIPGIFEATRFWRSGFSGSFRLAPNPHSLALTPVLLAILQALHTRMSILLLSQVCPEMGFLKLCILDFSLFTSSSSINAVYLKRGFFRACSQVLEKMACYEYYSEMWVTRMEKGSLWHHERKHLSHKCCKNITLNVSRRRVTHDLSVFPPEGNILWWSCTNVRSKLTNWGGGGGGGERGISHL